MIIRASLIRSGSGLLQWACAVLSLFALGAGAASAQCTIAITAVNVYEDCSNWSFPTVSAAWSGGTAPFTVTRTYNGVFGGQSSTSNQFWTAPANGYPNENQVTVTVTDALGCVVSGSTSWMNHFPYVPEVTITQDCATGNVLRWTGMYNAGVPQYSQCQGPRVYNLVNTTTGMTWNGIVSADWIQEPPNSWRFPTALPPGWYILDIFSSITGLTCTGMGVVECFSPAYLSVSGAPGPCIINFNLCGALAGALPSGTAMTDQLRTSGLIPTVEPYSALGYTYVGTTPGGSLQPVLLTVTGGTAIVDWVIVEVRSAVDPGTVLYSRPALIQRNGNVIDQNGASYISAPLPPGSYHVALRHRNHLGVMTGAPRALTADPAATMIDFRLGSTPTYGTNARTAVGSVQCLWPGNTNGDGGVGYVGAGNDRDPVLIAIGGSIPTATVSNVYDARDVNLDGSIRYAGGNNDRDPILITVGGSVPTATRMQQLP